MPPARDPLWRPALIVFVSNICIMVIELVASRLLAPAPELAPPVRLICVEG